MIISNIDHSALVQAGGGGAPGARAPTLGNKNSWRGLKSYLPAGIPLETFWLRHCSR